MPTSQSAMMYISILKAPQSLSEKKNKIKTVVLTFPKLILFDQRVFVYLAAF